MISRVFRRVYPQLIYLRFLLFQRHRHNRLVLEHAGGKPFLVLPEVFNPTLFFSSTFFVRSVSQETIPSGSLVLDLGTGSGIGAIFAARWANIVFAVDSNPEAVRCTKINALLNHVEDRLVVREGDLFLPVAEETFDVVLFNPPYLHGAPKNRLEEAFYSTTVAARFGDGLKIHLKPGGHSLVVLSDIGNEGDFLDAWRKNGFREEIVAERRLPNERLRVYRVRL